MTAGKFEPIKMTEQSPSGKFAAIFCGYTTQEYKTIQIWLKNLIMFSNLKTIFANENDLHEQLKKLFENEKKTSEQVTPPKKMPLAIIFSGFSGTQVHQFIAEYKTTKYSTPIWAARTEMSETWELGKLLTELQKEHASMHKK